MLWMIPRMWCFFLTSLTQASISTPLASWNLMTGSVSDLEWQAACRCPTAIKMSGGQEATLARSNNFVMGNGSLGWRRNQKNKIKHTCVYLCLKCVVLKKKVDELNELFRAGGLCQVMPFQEKKWHSFQKATGAQQVAWKGVSHYMAMIKMMESQLHPIQRSSWTSDWLEWRIWSSIL